MRGYEKQSSTVTFDVEQGQPLCSTRDVFHLPLSIVREDGKVCTWDDCLFIIADAGADLIIAKKVLEKGDILKYRPPKGYENLLA